MSTSYKDLLITEEFPELINHDNEFGLSQILQPSNTDSYVVSEFNQRNLKDMEEYKTNIWDRKLVVCSLKWPNFRVREIFKNGCW